MNELIGKVDKNIINKNIDKINEADIILMQLEIPIETVKYVCEIAKNKKIILDPAPANIEIVDDTLKKCFLIKPNETELKILTQMPTETLEEVEKAGKELLNKGVQNVLVSLGDKGALLINNERCVFFPAKKTTAIDTTAAGDSFIAGVTLGLAEEKDLKESIEFASKIARITVSRQGAQKSIPSRNEVESCEN